MSEKNDSQKELEKLKAEMAALEAENAALGKELSDAKTEMQKAREEAEKAEALAREQSAKLDARVAKEEALIIEQLKRQRKVRIVIASGQSAHERCAVPVGVNGREFLIERDVEVDVPEGVLNVLDLAIANIGEIGSGQMASTDFHKTSRFAYRVIGYVDPKTNELVQ